MKPRIFPKILITFLVLAALAFSVIRIYQVNRQYPTPAKVKYEIGEMVQGGNTAVKVTDYRIVDDKDIKQMLVDQEIDFSLVNNQQLKFLLVSVQYINNTGQKQEMSVPSMIHAQTLTWGNGLDMEIFHQLNPNKNSPVFMTLEPKSTIELTLPYALYSDHFKKLEWENIKNLTFALPLSAYPVKYFIELKP